MPYPDHQPTVCALCPSSRPQFLGKVVEQFAAQTYGKKLLVVIANGDKAVHRAWEYANGIDVLLYSDHHQSIAKNVGLQWLREHGHLDSVWTIWDDDDDHGPGLLGDVARSVRPGSVAGRPNVFIVDEHGILYKVVRTDDYPYGATLAATVRDSLWFKNTGRWGEDEEWLDRMLSSRMTMRPMSEWHIVINRGPWEHAWNVGGDLALNSIVGGRAGVKLYRYGCVDPSFVLLRRQEPPHTVVPYVEYDWGAHLDSFRKAS